MFKPRKVGWSDCMVAWGWGETEKRRGETKILKRGGKLGLGVGVLKREGWNPLTNCGLDTEPADTFTSKISVNTLMRSLLKINDYLRGNHWQKKCLFSVKFTLIGMIPMLSCLTQEGACCVYIYCVLFNLLYSVSVLYTHIPHVWLSVFRFSNVTVFGNLKRLILQVFLLLLFKKSCFLPFYVRITAGIHAISICFMQM